MIRVSFVVSIVWMAGSVSAAPAPKDPGRTYLDLQPYGTHKLAEDSASGLAGNNLASVPTGESDFAGSWDVAAATYDRLQRRSVMN